MPRATFAFGSAALAILVCLTFCDDAVLHPLFESLSGGGSSYKLKLANWPILLLLTCTVPSLFYVTKTNRFDRLAGEMSYPIYISHLFVFSTINTYLPRDVQAGNALYIACVIVISLLLV